jgi:uncharacterized protein YjbI with pentapeptide repeats
MSESEAVKRLSERRGALRADCGSCAGLCCVAPAFTKSADFAVDKPAGTPCLNLLDDFRCGIHEGLRGSGFTGCTVFDCFGAGQQVTQSTFGGRNWRDEPGLAGAMFAGLGVMRQLHELRWYLCEAVELVPDGPLRDELDAARLHSERLSDTDAAGLPDVDIAGVRQQVGDLLGRASDVVRRGFAKAPDHRGADLIEVRWRGADLRGASFRGAYLLGADLRNADLRWADLLGADLRAARLSGAKLDGALFVTQPQLTAAHGDVATSIPAGLTRPDHWSTAAKPAGSAGAAKPGQADGRACGRSSRRRPRRR